MIDVLEDIEIPEEAKTIPAPYRYITKALFQLDENCDGARQDDCIGFSGCHTGIGKKLAERLRITERLTVKDIDWIVHSLPYYFNTQLTWIDKEYFYECTRSLYKEAQLADEKELERREIEKERREKLLKALTSREIAEIFLAIENVNTRDANFIRSLQHWKVKGRNWSSKQFYWVYKFVEQYGEF